VVTNFAVLLEHTETSRVLVRWFCDNCRSVYVLAIIARSQRFIMVFCLWCEGRAQYTFTWRAGDVWRRMFGFMRGWSTFYPCCNSYPIISLVWNSLQSFIYVCSRLCQKYNKTKQCLWKLLS